MIEFVKKVVPKFGGMKGMAIETIRHEGEKMKYINDHKSKLRKPVSTDFLVGWAALKKHVLSVCRLNNMVEESDIKIVSMECAPDYAGYILTAEVALQADSSSVVTMTTDILIAENYENYEVLEKDCQLIVAEVIKYAEGKTNLDARQFLLELMDENEKAGKEAEFSMEDIEKMNPKERMNIMVKELEDMGAIFMHVPDEETLVVNEPSTKMKSVKDAKDPFQE